MKKVGHLLEEKEKSQIEEAAKNVAQILSGEGKNAPTLKQANQVLDESTQSLAALLVDQAFSDAQE